MGYSVKETVSIDKFSKNAGKFILMLKKHELDKIAITRNNEIEAVILPVDTYEQLTENVDNSAGQRINIPTKDQVLIFLKENKDFLKKRFHITKIGFFGSVARGDAKQDSDIDFIIELEDDVDDIYEVECNLYEFLEKAFHRDIDIIRESYLKPKIKEHVISEVIYV